VGKGTTLSVVLSRLVVVMVVLILMALARPGAVAAAACRGLLPVPVNNAQERVVEHPQAGELAVGSVHLEEWPQWSEAIAWGLGCLAC